MKVVWTRPALADLTAVGEHVARDNPAAAERLLARIGARVRDLRERPHRGRIGRVPGTRELVVDGTAYIVAYQIEGDRLAILAVFHAARAWPSAF